MIKTETTLRVRYGETDQMGFVYYGVYAQYYEVGRVEAMRSLGFSYRAMEESGVLMPVINLTINYKKPALYDDEVRIVTTVKEMPGVRITFHYECFNQKNELLNTGSVTLVFIDKTKNKPMQPPAWFMEGFMKRFEKKT
ncbi:MAG: acyl-CoA thioesterase [Bacteroidetes bacterium]|jgi:acyl-CoA thioester hydrolase|nr:acyl-CoA thioesterase [Bacteroidota bacterium]